MLVECAYGEGGTGMEMVCSKPARTWSGSGFGFGLGLGLGLGSGPGLGLRLEAGADHLDPFEVHSGALVGDVDDAQVLAH